MRCVCCEGPRLSPSHSPLALPPPAVRLVDEPHPQRQQQRGGYLQPIGGVGREPRRNPGAATSGGGSKAQRPRQWLFGRRVSDPPLPTRCRACTPPRAVRRRGRPLSRLPLPLRGSRREPRPAHPKGCPPPSPQRRGCLGGPPTSKGAAHPDPDGGRFWDSAARAAPGTPIVAFTGGAEACSPPPPSHPTPVHPPVAIGVVQPKRDGRRVGASSAGATAHPYPH